MFFAGSQCGPNMNGKTPISALQELMAGKGLPLPVYTEEGWGTSFKCTVKAAGVIATGIATNKKTAKHESAKKALEKLGNPVNRQLIVVEQSAPIFRVVDKNYVGELNEFSSQKGLSYPDYTPVTASLTQFVCKCTFQAKETLGLGANKKDAKQDSAKKMLELVKAMEPVTFVKTIILEQNKLEVSNKDNIISLYESLSLSNKQSYPVKSNRLEAIPGIVTDTEDSVEILKDKLKYYDVGYSLQDIQSFPLIVSARITGTELYFLGTGRNREEATRSVLQDMLAIAKTGYTTNDLISFV